jgi:uncharacterized surface protein with fasciclin (FAS1) repeats
MKIFNSIKRISLLIAAVSVFCTACNKLELDPVPTTPAADNNPTLAALIDAPDFSLLKAAVVKAGLLTTLQNPAGRYTLFAPDDAAITASLSPILPPGVTPAMYIASLDATSAYGLIAYHVIPQEIVAASIRNTFPNFEYPTILNPAPSVNALLRLSTFPSVRAGVGAWVNNIPISATDIQAVNGVMHKVSRVVMPPSADLWSKIQADPELTYLKAAIARADSGVAPGGRLQDALNTQVNPLALASNLTIFAPTDAAMAAFITGAITQALVAQNIPLPTAQMAAAGLVANFGTLIVSNPAAIPNIPGFPPGIGAQLASVLTPTLAKGIVAYHVLSSQSGTYAPPGIRVFSVNIPTTATNAKTLLNSAVAAHPGVMVQASFAPGLPVVASATVKGAANATASNVIIGQLSSDLHYVNGVIHKIDQVLLPQ